VIVVIIDGATCISFQTNAILITSECFPFAQGKMCRHCSRKDGKRRSQKVTYRSTM